MEPTAAPISVFREARLILLSKRIMQIAMIAPAAAEIHGSLLMGWRKYPEATRIPVNIKRIMTTSVCMTPESYHGLSGSSLKTALSKGKRERGNRGRVKW
jgi:hypothetical protein